MTYFFNLPKIHPKLLAKIVVPFDSGATNGVLTLLLFAILADYFSNVKNLLPVRLILKH